MNRRHFLGHVALGSAFLASATTSIRAAGPRAGLRVKFVGMMGFVQRSDNSLLVALPGDQRFGHFVHVPFLMARAGSRMATALGMLPAPGVVAASFDYELTRQAAGPFVYRCLDDTDIQIAAAGNVVPVDNRATELAQMHRIAPGKRLRGNLQRWSNASIALTGGSLSNAAAHPDAGKVWSFGAYQQPLTDAALYESREATIRLGRGPEARALTVGDRDAEELWVVSAAAMRHAAADPRTLDHGDVLFDYLVDAAPITATCPEAEGWMTEPTDLPCAHGLSASLAGAAAPAYPPYAELCYNAFFGGI